MVERAVEQQETLALLLFLPAVAVLGVAMDETDFLSCDFLTSLSKLALAPVLLMLEGVSTARLAPVWPDREVGGVVEFLLVVGFFNLALEPLVFFDFEANLSRFLLADVFADVDFFLTVGGVVVVFTMAFGGAAVRVNCDLRVDCGVVVEYTELCEEGVEELEVDRLVAACLDA